MVLVLGWWFLFNVFNVGFVECDGFVGVDGVSVLLVVVVVCGVEGGFGCGRLNVFIVVVIFLFVILFGLFMCLFFC